MYDVIIVGGGPAGLTAALYLGRACRKVALFDDNQPRNAASHGMHGFISRDGMLPGEFRKISRDQLAIYPNIEIIEATVASGRRIDDGFEITLEDGRSCQSRKLILASGLKDNLSSVEGFNEFWGRGVFQCPYCDGWEVRDQPLVANHKGEGAFHMARLLTNWTGNLTICSDGPAELNDDQRQQLAAAGIALREEKIARLVGGDHLEQVIFEDGSSIPCGGLFTRLSQQQRGSLAENLGCELDEFNLVKTTETGATAIPGLYVTGDSRTLGQNVVMAAAAGGIAAGQVSTELAFERFANLAAK